MEECNRDWSSCRLFRVIHSLPTCFPWTSLYATLRVFLDETRSVFMQTVPIHISSSVDGVASEQHASCSERQNNHVCTSDHNSVSARKAGRRTTDLSRNVVSSQAATWIQRDSWAGRPRDRQGLVNHTVGDRSRGTSQRDRQCLLSGAACQIRLRPCRSTND